MNVTEVYEELLRLASAAPVSAHTPRTARAVNAFARRTLKMRRELDQRRKEREFFRRLQESHSHLQSSLARLRECHTCGWSFNRDGWNALRKCTGDFGCALEFLRYKSCEYTPLTPKP